VRYEFGVNHYPFLLIASQFLAFLFMFSIFWKWKKRNLFLNQVVFRVCHVLSFFSFLSNNVIFLLELHLELTLVGFVEFGMDCSVVRIPKKINK